MIKLRGHHLICLHFFKGEGYSKRFINNLKGIVKSLENDTKARIVDGADDVCSYCPHLQTNFRFADSRTKRACIYRPGYEKEIAALDKMALKLLNLKKGDALLWKKIKVEIPGILPKWREFTCLSCDWAKVCYKEL